MGCRPSRRAVASVRVAGEGPNWGLGRSSRPRATTGDGGVRLRPRSNSKRRSRDGGRNEGGGNPRDRYSAPPTDRQFPPHSCTSATYEHGCCGTSRITLRLSKNGSTLEIEKCDFHNSVRTCERCGPRDTPNTAALLLDVPLRTQSAPNLSVDTYEDRSWSSPHTPQHSSRVVVESETYLPPQSSYRMESGDHQTRTGHTRKDSLPTSVRTATRVDVDVEISDCSHDPSSINNSFHEKFDSPAVNHYVPCWKRTAHESIELRAQALTVTEMPVYVLENDALSDQSGKLIGNDQLGPCVQSTYLHAQNREGSIKSSSKVDKLTFTESLKEQDIATQVVDLTDCYAENTGLFDDDSECAGNQRVWILKSCQDNDASCSSGQMRMSINNHNKNLGCQDNAGSDAGKCCTGQDNNGNSMVTGDEAIGCLSKGKVASGSTDYRVRLLGAQADELTSHMTNATVSSPCVMTSVSRGQHLTPVRSHANSSNGHQVMTNTPGSEAAVDTCNDHVRAVGGSGRTVVNRSGVVPLAKCKERQVTVSCKDMMGILSKLDSGTEKSADTKCMSIRDSKKHEVDHLEMSPSYAHADLNGELASG